MPVTDQGDSLLATVDLGSNSFHMVVAREEFGQLVIIDRLKEMARLSGGLDEEGWLDEASQVRALECLSRFGQRLRGIPPERIRVLGTSTLRRARNSRKFRARAAESLGHPVEVISGREEARLIYLGVAGSLGFDDSPRFVVDIGGGSTEVIVGRQFKARRRESLEMGCVNFTRKFFPDGRITQKRMNKAVLAARVEIEPIAKLIRDENWVEAIGCSGTIRAAAAVAEASNFSDDGLSKSALNDLVKVVVKAGSVDELNFKGLSVDRQLVFPGGVAILAAVFDELEIDHMSVSDKALREGALFDLKGRLEDDDVRETAIAGLCARHGVDVVHAERVKETALMLYRRVSSSWELDDESYYDMLRWAAWVHEIGFAVSHLKYHKHGQYLIENADLDGFSDQERTMLATLVRSHRRRLDLQVFNEVGSENHEAVIRLALLLRLAVLLNRGRIDTAPSDLVVTAGRKRITLKFPQGWLDQHPLTQEDLLQERDFVAKCDFKISVKSQS